MTATAEHLSTARYQFLNDFRLVQGFDNHQRGGTELARWHSRSAGEPLMLWLTHTGQASSNHSRRQIIVRVHRLLGKKQIGMAKHNEAFLRTTDRYVEQAPIVTIDKHPLTMIGIGSTAGAAFPIHGTEQHHRFLRPLKGMNRADGQTLTQVSVIRIEFFAHPTLYRFDLASKWRDDRDKFLQPYRLLRVAFDPGGPLRQARSVLFKPVHDGLGFSRVGP